MELGLLRRGKSVQYVKMGHAPRIAAQDENNWDLEQGVRETEKNFSTDLQLLMTETTNDPTLPKTLVCLERQQHELIPEEYLTHKKKSQADSVILHRGQDYRPKQSPNNGHQPTTQGPSRHQ